MEETEYKVSPHHSVVMDKQASESLYHTENLSLSSTAPTPTTAHTVVTSGFELIPSQPQNSGVFKFNGYNQDYDITPVKDLGTEEYSRVTIQKVELHKTEHPWIRPSKMEEDLSREERDTERLYRKFQGILNKLTPQKFQTLAEQALKLKIDSEQKLNGCADRIIANAIKEPKYSIAYANLYKVMNTIKVESTTEDERPQVVFFRRVVLSKLQFEFEKNKEDDEEREGLLRAIEAAQDPERKQQLRDRVKEWGAKSLKRSVGIVHYIGALFKLKMLPETVLHMCFARLLCSLSDSDSLECFAHLVTFTGKDVDKLKAKTQMDQYFTHISDIITKGKIPLRIKFMLQDIQELRANDWIPRWRHQAYSLKIIDQIHFEARIEEEKEKQLVAHSIAGSTKHGRSDTENSRQGYLRSNDCRERKDKNRDREGNELKDKLQGTGKLQLLLKEREKSEELPVEFHKVEHPWMRPSKVEGDLVIEERETERLLRKLQGILNKLTPQKFQTLAEQALKLKIDSEQRLKGCTDKIFYAALNDPRYSIVYANLCKVMSTIKVELRSKEGKAKIITFRRLLLTRVQQEFENKKGDKEKESILKTIKGTHNPARRRQLEQELKVHEAKNHKRSVNNICFMGELFRLKMLSETIVHSCIVRLLWSSADWQLLEHFAVLITITGKDLDHPDAQARIDQYFTRISEITKKGKIPLRIKFMLQDVQDLRANDWISRLRQDQTIKTIDQIHHDAKVEEEKRKHLRAQIRTHFNTTNSEVIRRVTVQPPGINFRPLGWQGRTKHKDEDKKEKLDAQRLQILLKHRYLAEQGKPFKHHTTFTLKNSEKQPAIPAGQCAVKHQQQQHQRTGSRGEHRQVQNIIDELAAVRQKTMATVDELIEKKDLETAVVYLYEMEHSEKMISETINHSLEKSSHHHQAYGHLFGKLIKEQLISEEKFIEGLNGVLECADDIAIDVPKMWDYLAEILSPIVSQYALSLSFLSSVPSSLLSSGKAGLLAVKVLAHCRKQLSCNDKVATIWATSSLEWSTLGISSEELPKLLSRHDLEYLLGTHQPQPDGQQQMRHVTELTHLLSNLAITTDDIIDWIESHFPTPVLITPEFVTTITTAIVDASILGSGARAHFQEEIFSLRVVCVRKYVDGDEDLQMRVLYALQLAVDKLEHPPGILNQMFSVIYDLEIIREKVFLKWRDFGSEAFSKGRAILSVKSFFDWLDCDEMEL